MKDESIIAFMNYDVYKTSTYLTLIWNQLNKLDKDTEKREQLMAFAEDLQEHFLTEHGITENEAYSNYYVNNSHCLDDISNIIMQIGNGYTKDRNDWFMMNVRSMYKQCTSEASVYDTDADKFDCFKEAIDKRCGSVCLVLVSSYDTGDFDIVKGRLISSIYYGCGFKLSDGVNYDFRDTYEDTIEINADFDISNNKKVYEGRFMVVTLYDNFGVCGRIGVVGPVGEYIDTIEKQKDDVIELRMNVKLHKPVKVLQLERL